MVVIKPFFTLKFSFITFTMGARQLVVQEAFEMMLCLAGSNFSSLMPMQMVMSSPLAGALMMTFLAPAAMCALAFSAAVKRPVDSMTISTPSAFHGSLAGSRSAMTLISLPSMKRDEPLASTAPGE